MKLEGNEQGIDALKALHKKNPGFVRALLDDVKSTTDNTTYFRDEQGNRYSLSLDPHSGALVLDTAPALSTRPPPPVE
ncbi:MAG: hypothetical protein R3B72_46265 [Polyangiaceae bacterium]